MRGGFVGKHHQSPKAYARQPLGEPRQRQRIGRCLHAVAAETRIAFDQNRQFAIARPRCNREPGEHGLVVRHDRKPRHPFSEVHQSPGLTGAYNIEGDQHVVANAGIRENLGLAEFLASEPDRAGLDLHGADGRYLVRFDMRPIVSAVRRDHALHTVDILLQAVEQDSDTGRIEPCSK